MNTQIIADSVNRYGALPVYAVAVRACLRLMPDIHIIHSAKEYWSSDDTLLIFAAYAELELYSRKRIPQISFRFNNELIEPIDYVRTAGTKIKGFDHSIKALDAILWLYHLSSTNGAQFNEEVSSVIFPEFQVSNPSDFPEKDKIMKGLSERMTAAFIESSQSDFDFIKIGGVNELYQRPLWAK